MRVFVASPYHSGSHRAWAEGLAAHSTHDIHLITMPGAFWQWRLTGSFVTLTGQIEALVEEAGPPDLIVATSLVDVAGLRGLLARNVGRVPVALYMHENQITYPAISRTRTERNYGLINWTSVLAADSTAFNSDFHRRSFFGSLPVFLSEFPDERHHHLLESAESAAAVLPVGFELEEIPTGPKDDVPLVLWNHRWDPDKDPATFLGLMQRLHEAEVDFRIALAGERFVNQRPEHDAAVELLGDRVVTDAHLDRGDYLEVLGRSTIVVSTALQEFFGLSVVEAMAAGAFPVLPSRLVYPERVPEDHRAAMLYRDGDHSLELLTAALSDVEATRSIGLEMRDQVALFAWSQVIDAYDDWLESTAAS